VYSHVNYITHNKHARGAAKATLGYNETRKGKDGEDIERTLFGKTGPLTREQAEWLIENASKNTYFFRWILSPDLKDENGEKNLDLWQLARDGVAWLEERLQRIGEIQLIGAEHNDHTGILHIHAILLIERQGRAKILTPKDLDEFRKAIHQMALKQRLTREQAIQQEAAETVQRVRENDATPASATPSPRHVSAGPVAVLEQTFAAGVPQCLVCRGGSRVELLEKGLDQCPACGRMLIRRKEVTLSLSH
jgi:hypothetical protein